MWRISHSWRSALYHTKHSWTIWYKKFYFQKPALKKSFTSFSNIFSSNNWSFCNFFLFRFFSLPFLLIFFLFLLMFSFFAYFFLFFCLMQNCWQLGAMFCWRLWIVEVPGQASGKIIIKILNCFRNKFMKICLSSFLNFSSIIFHSLLPKISSRADFDN